MNDSLEKYVPHPDSIEGKTLCPSLSSFKFTPDGASSTFLLDILDPVDDVLPPPVTSQTLTRSMEDDLIAHQNDNDDYGGGDEDFGFTPAGDALGGEGEVGGGGEDFFADLGLDSQAQGLQFVPGRGDGEVEGDMEVEASGAFEGLERVLMGKNWAGPEHWKMRRARAPPAAKTGSSLSLLLFIFTRSGRTHSFPVHDRRGRNRTTEAGEDTLRNFFYGPCSVRFVQRTLRTTGGSLDDPDVARDRCQEQGNEEARGLYVA
jgi:condensin complex subunit 2